MSILLFQQFLFPFSRRFTEDGLVTIINGLAQYTSTTKAGILVLDTCVDSAKYFGKVANDCAKSANDIAKVVKDSIDQSFQAEELLARIAGKYYQLFVEESSCASKTTSKNPSATKAATTKVPPEDGSKTNRVDQVQNNEEKSLLQADATDMVDLVDRLEALSRDNNEILKCYGTVHQNALETAINAMESIENGTENNVHRIALDTVNIAMESIKNGIESNAKITKLIAEIATQKVQIERSGSQV